ncbi:hypothetical protein WG901_10420 [Novosphingobium sp. PS1R-30]|uniref:Calcium-binding protein n=1 Tax=Novosphingobium anseongense TaxID=3133436 RepID=A0ABU8RVM4_9SPHN
MANLYLAAGDNISGLTFGGNVFGSTGSESVTYAAGVTGIVADQNVEQVRLAGTTGSYTFQQSGNQLLVFSGATQVARITLQNDANGTLITFGNGTVEAKVSASGMTLGGGTVPSAAPSAVVPTAIDTSNTTGTLQFVLTAGIDALTGSGGDDVFVGDAATITAADSINGGGGNDSLNIFGATGATVVPQLTDVENVNFNAPTVDIAVNTQSATGVNNIGLVNTATKVFAGLTIGATQNITFNNVTGGLGHTVTTTATDTAVGVGLTGSTLGTLALTGAAITSVNVTSNGTANTIGALTTTGAEDTVNVTGAADLKITTALDTTVKTVNAAAATGAINVGITTATTAAIAADVSTGSGKDTIAVATTGTGTTTVNAGAGNDTVNITARSSGKLTVNLGAGDDTLNITGAAIAAGDVIDGGDGKDTLLLSIVGASNIASFSNFEVFDAKGLGKTLDIDILASKNTVTEIITTGDVGATAALTNVGAGVGYRVTGDTDVTKALTLTQKAAGALTVTIDIDEPATTPAATTTASTAHDAAVVAANATSLKAVFDSAFFDKATGAGDNVANLALTGSAATTLEIVSGGTNAVNDLDYTTGSASSKGVLTSATISGTQAIDFDVTSADPTQLATVNASTLTGALTFSLNDLKLATVAANSKDQVFNGGTVTLGSGADIITAVTAANGSTISGIQKGTGEDQTTAGAADTIKIAAAVQASDVADTGVFAVKDGLLTFSGAGPATLQAAILIAQGAAESANETVVFQYLTDSYVFGQGTTNGTGDDVVIKLAGTTSLVGLDNYSAGNVYVF